MFFIIFFGEKKSHQKMRKSNKLLVFYDIIKLMKVSYKKLWKLLIDKEMKKNGFDIFCRY